MWNSPEEEIKDTVRMAHDHGVKVEALFHNLLYGSSAISEQVVTHLLTDRRLSEQLAHNLVELAKRMEFDGINIDIEFVPPSMRHQFTAFVGTISRALRRENIRVSLSVPAKTGDDPWNGWSGGYDYAALGALVDRLMLMTYDEHGWASETDGPIASAGWVERVVQHAVREVPADKLILGIPAYGFRWTSGQKNPVYLDYVTAMGPVWRGEAVLRWDNEAQVPMYRYGGADGALHRVWFENASSSSWKLDIMQRYGLRGFALWRAGMEDPDFWRLVGQKMKAERDRNHK
jgi:spore germination protein YaaH